MDNTLHLFQMTYWDIMGKWHCNDVKNLAGRSAKWYTPMRILNLDVEDYIKLLLSYNAKGLKYYPKGDYLAFHFESEKDVKAFCSYINKKAKLANYYCS